MLIIVHNVVFHEDFLFCQPLKHQIFSQLPLIILVSAFLRALVETQTLIHAWMRLRVLVEMSFIILEKKKMRNWRLAERANATTSQKLEESQREWSRNLHRVELLVRS